MNKKMSLKLNKKLLSVSTIFVFLLIFTSSLNVNTVNAANGVSPEFKQVKAANNQTVYFLDHKLGKKKAYVNEVAYFSYGNKWNDVRIVSNDVLSKWPDVTLVKVNNSKAVFYIKNYKKAVITSESMFTEHGFRWEDIVIISQTDLNQYQTVDFNELYYSSPVETLKNSSINTNTNVVAGNSQSDYSVRITPYKVDRTSYEAGSRRIEVGRFYIQNDSQEGMINTIVLKTSSDGIKESDGYGNMRAYIGNIGIGEAEMSSNGTNFVFKNVNYRLLSNSDVTLKVYIDSDLSAEAKSFGLAVEKMEITSKKSGEMASINGLGTQTDNVTIKLASNSVRRTTGNSTDDIRQNIVTTAENSGLNNTVSDSLPIWPVNGYVTYGFRDPDYPYKNSGEHNGIDIKVAQGSAVKASDKGVVAMVKEPEVGEFSYIVIKHDNGMYTLYGHLSGLSVVAGQSVQKGQLIGLSGGQPGTAGAGMNTNGAHMHFEVYQNGSYIDPLDYLENN